MNNNSLIFPDNNNKDNIKISQNPNNPFYEENKYPSFSEDINDNYNNFNNNENDGKFNNNFSNNNNNNNNQNFRNNYNYNEFNNNNNFNKNKDFNNNNKFNYINNFNNYNNFNNNFGDNNKVININEYEENDDSNNFNNNNNFGNNDFNNDNYFNKNLNINNFYNDINHKNINNNNNYQKKDCSNLIKLMSVLNSNRTQQNWKDNLKSFVSSLYYNDYGLAKKFDQNSTVFPLYFFDKEINKIIRDEVKYQLYSFLYMSYRSGFMNLNNIGCKDLTSDCGWGCMLRCCQMLLSRGLIKKKIFDFFQYNKNGIINFNGMSAIRKEILCLFYDNYLGIELAREHPDLQYFWCQFENFARDKPIYNSIAQIIPPYSIHILCKLSKSDGVFTSDLKIIKQICEINSQIFNDMNFIHFDSGLIDKKKLIKTFCEECMDYNDNKVLTFNGVDYQFKKGGIGFISLRLGLYNLDPYYYDFILNIFSNFKNNLGFVGGKKDRAYYFIGKQGDNKLIFVDPHANQQTENDIEKVYKTYFTENLYLLDIQDLTSSFTFAVGIFNLTYLIDFIEDLTSCSNHKKYKEFLSFAKE